MQFLDQKGQSKGFVQGTVGMQLLVIPKRIVVLVVVYLKRNMRNSSIALWIVKIKRSQKIRPLFVLFAILNFSGHMGKQGRIVQDLEQMLLELKV